MQMAQMMETVTNKSAEHTKTMNEQATRQEAYYSKLLNDMSMKMADMQIEAGSNPSSSGTQRDRGLASMKFLDNMESFSGVTSEFFEWSCKVKNFIKCKSPEVHRLMTDAENEKNPIIRSNIITAYETKYGKGQIAGEYDSHILAFLNHHTKGDAHSIVNQSKDCGCEAWRALQQRYDPRTNESRRALMKKMLIVRRCKSHKELEGKVYEWETDLRRYEEATSKKVEDDQKVCTIIEMCPDKLKEALVTGDHDAIPALLREVSGWGVEYTATTSIASYYFLLLLASPARV